MKYIKELIILIIQLLVYYILPLFMGPTDAMGVVFLLILSVFILGLILGFISNNKIKYIYPLFSSLLFLPAVFIYFNITTLIYILWFFILSLMGILSSTLLRKLIKWLYGLF